MPNDDLNQAIQFVQQGQDEQAQPILQALIQANPQDLTVWSWYVKSCRTPERRLEALETCLIFNPGDAQISEAIKKMREKVAAEEIPGFTPSAKTSSPTLNPEPYTYYIAPTMPEAVNEIEPASEPTEFKGLDQFPGRPFIWYDVWLRALTLPTLDSYTALLRDPLARPMRAYGWVFVSSMVTLLVLIIAAVSMTNPSLMELLNQFGRQYDIKIEDTKNFGPTLAIVLIVLVPIQAALNVLDLIIRAAIYAFLAGFLGGSGNFSRTVYLLGAWLAPLSIVTGILASIFFIIRVQPIGIIILCLAIPFSIYPLWLTITSLRAAHRMQWGQSFLVIFLTGLVSGMLSCVAQVILDGLLRSFR